MHDNDKNMSHLIFLNMCELCKLTIKMRRREYYMLSGLEGEEHIYALKILHNVISYNHEPYHFLS